MWNDINLYNAVRDFTSDPVSFPPEEMRAFITELVCDDLVLRIAWCLPEPQAANNQHYIPIVDAAVAKQVNDTDIVRSQTVLVWHELKLTKIYAVRSLHPWCRAVRTLSHHSAFFI